MFTGTYIPGYTCLWSLVSWYLCSWVYRFTVTHVHWYPCSLVPTVAPPSKQTPPAVFSSASSPVLPAGTDLLQVAAHEFGHVLGLQHSHKPKTIMYEYYSFSYPLKLSEDDKQGIQYLYGAKPRAVAPPPTTPPPPPPPPPPPVHTETNEIPVSPTNVTFKMNCM